MNKQGPILIIEDNLGDQLLFADVFEELKYENELIFFSSGEQALEFLTKTDIEPFLVLSDIYLPKFNGLELRNKIRNNEDLRMRSIPYLFITNSSQQQHVVDAYSRSIQGFFIKQNDFDQIKSMMKKIVEYWQECVSPNYIKNAQ